MRPWGLYTFFTPRETQGNGGVALKVILVAGAEDGGRGMPPFILVLPQTLTEQTQTLESPYSYTHFIDNTEAQSG